jgi:hypothetical protein
MKNNILDNLLKKCNEKHNYKYNYSLVEYKKLKSKVKIICPEHGIFEQRLDSHKISGCPECSSNKLSTDLFIKKAKEIHDDKYDYSLVNYKNAKTPIKIICKEHGEFNLLPESHLYKKRGCSICSGNKITTEMFIKKAKEIHRDKYDYSLVNYINNYTKIKIICEEHGIFEMTPNNHISRKQGCGKCVGRYRTTNEFIEKAKEIHGEKYDYNLVNYIKSHNKVKILCKKHNKIFKQSSHDHLSGNGCPLCNESKGENIISKFLENKNIIYHKQYKFNDCKYKRKLPFDFYLPEYNTCIEYDGKQHFEIIEYWGGLKNFEEIKLKDKIKTDYCYNNNINLIRIKYNENILDILNEKINVNI